MPFNRKSLAVVAAAVALAATVASGALAQPAAPPPAKPGLALTNFPAKGGKTLAVTSPAFANGGDIPFENTQYRGNVFPGLSWTKGPYGTRSYAIVMQDADVNYKGGPLLHWTMYAIPAGVTKLAPGMAAPPPGASYGPNVRGPNHAYMGPHTPPGPKHHYHFEVFALDREIAVDPALTYDAMAQDLDGHVLASGEVVGLGQADPTAPPRAPAAPPPASAPPAPQAPTPPSH
jgi:para-nitrobenzyl esterase